MSLRDDTPDSGDWFDTDNDEDKLLLGAHDLNGERPTPDDETPPLEVTGLKRWGVAILSFDDPEMESSRSWVNIHAEDLLEVER